MCHRCVLLLLCSGLNLFVAVYAVFFAHCHPQRNLIHKPSFSAALSHSRTPCYLLYAICALAAPMSKQRAVKTVPPRMAGVPYGQLAMAQMFDQHGRLIVEHNLVTVQALMIIQSHEMTVSWPWTASTRYQGQWFAHIISCAIKPPSASDTHPPPILLYIPCLPWPRRRTALTRSSETLTKSPICPYLIYRPPFVRRLGPEDPRGRPQGPRTKLSNIDTRSDPRICLRCHRPRMRPSCILAHSIHASDGFHVLLRPNTA